MAESKDWFEVINEVVTIKEEAKLIPEFAKLLERDNTKNKTRCKKEWEYIYHMVSGKSAYATYSDDLVREKIVIEDFIKESNWKPDKDLILARNKYRESRDSSQKKLLRAADLAANAIAVFLTNQSKNVDLDNFDAVIKGLEKIGKVTESLQKLKEQVDKEQANNNEIRGGGDIGRKER